MPLLTIDEDHHNHDGDEEEKEDHHDHGPLYKKGEADVPFDLTPDEQETFERLLDRHHPKTMSDVAKAYKLWEEVKDPSRSEKVNKARLEKFVSRYDYILRGEKKDLKELLNKKDDEAIIKAIDKALICKDYKAFLDRFEAMLYERETKDGWELVHAQEIKKGDRVRVEAGRIIPTDGIVKEVDGSKLGVMDINAKAYSGDEDLPVFEGELIYQTGVVPNEEKKTLTYEATEGYWQSTGITILEGFAAKKATKDQNKDKNIERYVTAMLAAGGILFFKDAIKKSPEGHYLDFASLTAKENISKTFEFFVSAAPCPLTVSAFARDGVINKLKKPKEEGGAEVYVQNRDGFIEAGNTDVVIFDVTGTLTKGQPEIDGDALQVSDGVGEQAIEELKAIAYKLESGQRHPVARTIRKFTRESSVALAKEGREFVLDIEKENIERENEGKELEELKVRLHGGLDDSIDGMGVHIGNLGHYKLLQKQGEADYITESMLEEMQEAQEKFIGEDPLKEVVFVMRQTSDNAAQWMMLGSKDIMRENAAETIKELIMVEGKEVVIATGSSWERTDRIKEKIAEVFKSEEEKNAFEEACHFHAELMPGVAEGHEEGVEGDFWEDQEVGEYKTKTQVVAKYQEEGKVVMMVGDGENDAPAIQKADVSIAISDTATAVVSHSATITAPNIEDALKVIRISRETEKKVNRMTGLAGAWMGFLVVLHFVGEKMKEAVGFELGATAKGILHEGSTLIITMLGLRNANVLTDKYHDYGVSKDKGEVSASR